jgi:hypothetical protein
MMRVDRIDRIDALREEVYFVSIDSQCVMLISRYGCNGIDALIPELTDLQYI